MTFGQVVRRFRANLEQLREFVTLLDPLIQAEAERAVKERQPSIRALVAAFDRAAKQGIIRAAPPAPPAASDGAVVIPVAPVDSGDSALGEGGDDSLRDGDVEIRPAGKDTVAIEVKRAKHKEFERLFKDLGRGVAHRNHLRESSLVSLTSAAEIFFGNLLRVYYRLRPEAAELQDKSLTFRELMEIADLEEARRRLLDSKIDQILRGSFSDWIDHARQKLGLSMGYLDPHRERLVEVFQRRNLIVHAGGIVNGIYLSKTSEAVRGAIKVDQRIAVPAEYLLRAIDQIELNFLLLACELWKRMEQQSEDRVSFLIDAALEYLEQDRFSIAEGLSRFGMGEKAAPERVRLVCEVNYWQSIKWQDRMREIEPDIRKADYSAKTPDFGLALLALLSDADGFFRVAPEVLTTKYLSTDDLRTWPLFREMRRDPRFPGLLGQAVSNVAAPPAEPASPDSDVASVQLGAAAVRDESGSS